MAMKQFVQRKKKYYSPVEGSYLRWSVITDMKVVFVFEGFFSSIPVVLEVREALAVEYISLDYIHMRCLSYFRT